MNTPRQALAATKHRRHHNNSQQLHPTHPQYTTEHDWQGKRGYVSIASHRTCLWIHQFTSNHDCHPPHHPYKKPNTAAITTTCNSTTSYIRSIHLNMVERAYEHWENRPPIAQTWHRGDIEICAIYAPSITQPNNVLARSFSQVHHHRELY